MVKRMRLVAFDGVMARALNGPSGILPKGGCCGKHGKASGVLALSQPRPDLDHGVNRVRANLERSQTQSRVTLCIKGKRSRPMVHAVVPIGRQRCSRKTHRGSLALLRSCFSAG